MIIKILEANLHNLSVLLLLIMMLFAFVDQKAIVQVFRSIYTCVGAVLNYPLDILNDLVSDRINYPRNLLQYKREKKKNEYWHLVPEETQKTWIDLKENNQSFSLLSLDEQSTSEDLNQQNQDIKNAESLVNFQKKCLSDIGNINSLNIKNGGKFQSYEKGTADKIQIPNDYLQPSKKIKLPRRKLEENKAILNEDFQIMAFHDNFKNQQQKSNVTTPSFQPNKLLGKLNPTFGSTPKLDTNHLQ